MKKVAIGFIAALLLAGTCDAKPHIKWKKVGEISLYAGAIAANVAATWGGHVCRVRNGVEPCTAHYGEFWATEGARAGVTATFIGLSYYGHKAGFKEWWAPTAGIAAFNGYWAKRELGIHRPREPRFEVAHDKR